MRMNESLRIVVVAPDLAVADSGDAHAIAQAERSRSLRIGLLENGFNLVASLPADVFLTERLAQLQPDLIIVDAESEARDALEHVVMATRDARRPIVMFTNDDDTTHVKDAVAATIFLAERIDGGGLFNIGSGQPNTWTSLVTPIFSGEPKIEFIDMPEGLRPKYQYFTCADMSKLRAAGFTQPFTPLADAVSDYVKNYLIPGKHLGD